MEIKIMKSVMDAYQNRADEIRNLLKQNNIYMLNFIGTPGAGKTAIIDKIIEYLKNKINIAVIEGDLATDRDAQRLKKHDIPIIMINTESGCYLPSISIENALNEINLNEINLIIIENVGNLVCPAHFDVGENAKIAVLSVTEGDDKPAKYPLLFHEAKAVILNKIDLIPYVDFNKKAFDSDLKKINKNAVLFETACVKDQGIDKFLLWLKKQFLKKA